MDMQLHHTSTCPCQPAAILNPRLAHTTHRSIAARIFEGIERGGLYQGSLLPVMATNKPMFDVLQGIAAVHPSILATSTRKIQQCKMLFDRCARCPLREALVQWCKAQQCKTHKLVAPNSAFAPCPLLGTLPPACT